MKKSEIIVIKLLADLINRKGFEDQWFTIDEDVRNEIKQEWIKIVDEEISSAKQTQAAEGLKLGDMSIEFGKKE